MTNLKLLREVKVLLGLDKMSPEEFIAFIRLLETELDKSGVV